MWPRLTRLLRVALVVSLVLVARVATAGTTVPPGGIANQTWTPAGSPYQVTGDITVPTGVTLTIQAGTVVQFAAGDASGGGLSGTKTELTVAGTLLVGGSWSNPVTFEAQTGTTSGIWYGIVAGASAAVSITGAVITEAQIGISGSTTSGLLAVSQTLIRRSVEGISVTNALISEVGVSGMGGTGIAISGSGSIINAIVDHCATGILAAGAASNAVVIIENCTLDSNAAAGVLAAGASGSSVSLVNDLITNNGTFGIERIATSVSSTYCDVWNNASGNYSNVTAGTGSISADPLYVSAIASQYHFLTAASPAIDTGTSVGAPGQDFDLQSRPQDGDGMNGAQVDMGAYEYPAAGGVDAGSGTGGAGGGGAGGGGAGGASADAGETDGGGFDGGGDAAAQGGAGGGGGASGTGGGAGGGVGVGGGSAGTAGHDAATDAHPSGSASSGCGCQTGGGGPGPLGLVLATVGALLAGGRRRRLR